MGKDGYKHRKTKKKKRNYSSLKPFTLTNRSRLRISSPETSGTEWKGLKRRNRLTRSIKKQYRYSFIKVNPDSRYIKIEAPINND